MKNEITTKDLGALNEIMTFENWMAVKLIEHSKQVTDGKLKTQFKNMAKVHAGHHKNLLDYLQSNSN